MTKPLPISVVRKRPVPPSRATHRMSRTPEHQAWAQMKHRCYNPSNKSFKNYGGRGIAVCEWWRNSFEHFFADMGPRPSRQHSLDRWPDKNGDYEPNNCRWALPRQQMNNVRYNRYFTIDGVSKTAAQWCRERGVKRNTFESRLARGWDISRALTASTL